METEPLNEQGTNGTEPQVIAGLAGAAAFRQEPISGKTNIELERSARDYPFAVGNQLEEDSPQLFEQGALESYRIDWGAIQTGFVDNPRGAVRQADELVVAVMKRLAEVFGDERANLEQAWAKGDDVSTEELRVALRRYRSFFDRLLAV